jgi:predicted DNA-binding transcriptional regulator AlpA
VNTPCTNAAAEWGMEQPAKAPDLEAEQLLEYPDVMRVLRLSKRSVVELANRGDLPRVRLLRRCLFDPADVRRLIEASKAK